MHRPTFLRLFGWIYLFAFTSVYVQFQGLYGRDGLMPIEAFLKRQPDQLTFAERFLDLPTLAWLSAYVKKIPIDIFMEGICMLGITVSTLMINGYGNMLVPGLLWAFYLSLYQVGQTFLSFQWDIMLLEAGFLLIWLSSPWKEGFQTPKSIEWCFRFLLFKLMYMAGAVKIQANCPTWLKLTALEFHYATQCIPTPLAWYAHQLPPIVHRVFVAATLVIEGPATFFIIAPVCRLREIAAAMQLLLQISIFVTGNYTFFNLLTALLCIALLESPSEQPTASSTGKLTENIMSFLSAFYVTWCSVKLFHFPEGRDQDIYMQRIHLTPSVDDVQSYIHRTLPIAIGAVLAMASYDTLRQIASVALDVMKSPDLKAASYNIIRAVRLILIAGIALGIFAASTVTFSTLDREFQAQLPRPAFDIYHATAKFHVTSPYGLFRRMTGVGEITVKEGNQEMKKHIVARPEIIVEGSNDGGKTWKPYHFKYKPGAVDSRPPFVAPHQPRLDWQMWFAALGSYQGAPWFVHLIDKLLEGSVPVKRLLDSSRNPFPDTPPTKIRARLFHYDFTRSNTTWAQKVYGSDIRTSPKARKDWWRRRYIREYIPVLEKGNPSVKEFLQQYGWERADRSKPVYTCTAASLSEAFQCNIFFLLSGVHEYEYGPHLVSLILFLVTTFVCQQSRQTKPNRPGQKLKMN